MAAEVLRNFGEAMAEAPDDVGAAVVLASGPREDFIPQPVRGQPICLVGLIHAGPIEAGEDGYGRCARSARRPWTWSARSRTSPSSR
jgi:hypothetical protein